MSLQDDGKASGKFNLDNLSSLTNKNQHSKYSKLSIRCSHIPSNVQPDDLQSIKLGCVSLKRLRFVVLHVLILFIDWTNSDLLQGFTAGISIF